MYILFCCCSFDFFPFLLIHFITSFTLATQQLSHLLTCRPIYFILRLLLKLTKIHKKRKRNFLRYFYNQVGKKGPRSRISGLTYLILYLNLSCMHTWKACLLSVHCTQPISHFRFTFPFKMRRHEDINIMDMKIGNPIHCIHYRSKSYENCVTRAVFETRVAWETCTSNFTFFLHKNYYFCLFCFGGRLSRPQRQHKNLTWLQTNKNMRNSKMALVSDNMIPAQKNLSDHLHYRYLVI